MAARIPSRPMQEGRVGNWLVLGPFDHLVTGRPLISAEKMPGLLFWGGEAALDRWPEDGLTVPSGGQQWRMVTSKGQHCRIPVEGAGRWPRWCYAAAYLRCYERFSGAVELRCDGCFLLRCGSKPVASHLGWPRTWQMPPARAALELPEGCHLLLLKLISYGGPLTFDVHVLGPDGAPLRGRRPVAVRISPLQGMKLNAPARGKRLPARPEPPTLCTAGEAEEGRIASDPHLPVWSKGTPAGTLRALDGKRARWRTAVSFAYTDAALYALCECENGRPSSSTEPLPWLSDHVVLLLDPEHAHQRSVAILLNLNGELWTSRGERGAIGSEVRVGEDGWIGMLRIPFDFLRAAGRPERGERWGINVVRVCPGSSDGLTYWTDGLLHWDEERLVPAGGGRGFAAEARQWPSLTAPVERFGHLEFGQNDICLERAALGEESPGRLELRLVVNNRGRKARAHLSYEVKGRAEMWPTSVARTAALESGQKSWLLQARSRTSGSVSLGPLPPGDYTISARIEVPGRDFVQWLAVPFQAPRQLGSSERRAFSVNAASDATAATGRVTRQWDFYLAERPPHELLLTLLAGGPREGICALWNGNSLSLAVPPDEAPRWWSEAPVPSAFVNAGLNRLEISAPPPRGGEALTIEEVRLRIHEQGSRDVETGRRLYECSLEGGGPSRGERVLFSRSETGIPHAPTRLVELQEGCRLRFAMLLDRPGGTLGLTHADFRLEIDVVAADPAPEAEPPALDVELNGSKLQVASVVPHVCFLARRKGVRWHYEVAVPEGVPQNGVNYCALRAGGVGGGSHFLEAIRLEERRWDDPDVVGVPQGVRVGDAFQITLRTDRQHVLRYAELPPHLGALFRCPLNVNPGETAVPFEARAAGVPTRAALALDEGFVCFTAPAVLPNRRGLGAGRPSAPPLFRLRDGQQELFFSAVRGKLRQEGRDEFRVAPDGVTVPYGSERQKRRFRSLLYRTAFLSGADVSNELTGTLPPLHRRGGLPAVKTAVVVDESQASPDRLGFQAPPAVKSLSNVLLRGAAFPGPGGPLFPSAPTGHFSGTPRGKFDIVDGSCGERALRTYALLFLEEKAATEGLLSALKRHVLEEGAIVVLSAADLEAMECFDIPEGRQVRAEHVTFQPTDGGALRVAVEGDFLAPGGQPDDTRAVFEGSGLAALGAWRRGRGAVYTVAAPVADCRGEVEFRSHCFERVLRAVPPSIWCDSQFVSFSVFPEGEGSGAVPSATHVGPSFAPCRIYLTDVEWWDDEREEVHCNLFLDELSLPLAWPVGRVKAVFVSGALAVTDVNDQLYFEGASRREKGYEIQVRGSGTHSIMALSMAGKVSSITCRGEQVAFGPAGQDLSLVRFDLAVAGMMRFQVQID